MSVKIQEKGNNYRFKLDRRISKENFKQIVGIDDCWYFRGIFYLKPHKLDAVKDVLNGLGFEVEEKVTKLESQSKVLKHDVPMIIKLNKIFKFKSKTICGKRGTHGYLCERQPIVKGYGSYCRVHGYTKSAKVLWYATTRCKIADEEEMMVLFYDSAFTKLLNRGKVSKQEMLDHLKSLRDELYEEQLEQKRKEVSENTIGKEFGLVGDIIEWKKNGEPVVFFKAKKIMSQRELTVYRNTERFISGDLKEIQKIAENTLPAYQQSLEYRGDIPMVILQNNFDEDSLQIRIRAPVESYGQAYRISVAVNGIHIFPAVPTSLKVFNNDVDVWAYRIYHTKEWKERLKYRLEYIKTLEERTMAIANKLREITDFEISTVLNALELEDRQKSKIINKWKEGTLFDLAIMVAKEDSTKGMQAIKEDVKAIYYGNFERGLVGEFHFKEIECQERVSQ